MSFLVDLLDNHYPLGASVRVLAISAHLENKLRGISAPTILLHWGSCASTQWYHGWPRLPRVALFGDCAFSLLGAFM